MTVLTQMSVGAFTTIWLLQLLGVSRGWGLRRSRSLLVGGLALNASTLHLGRPMHAYRAMRMWRRSWLSREVLLFTSFSGVAGVVCRAAVVRRCAGVPDGMTTAVGALTVLLGIAGVTASACIYRVPSRPAWNTRYTLLAVQPDGRAARTAVCRGRRRRRRAVAGHRGGDDGRARSSCCWPCASCAASRPTASS